MRKTTLVLLLTSTLFACKKAAVVAPPDEVLVTERLVISPASSSILVGETAQFSLKFFNNRGVESAIPAGTVWSSSSDAVVTMNQQGLAAAVAEGSATIKATYNTISATVPITVVANNTQLATIMIMPATIQEILLNQTTALTATAKNNAGGIIPGITFSWFSDAATVAAVSNMGVATGIAYGTTNITASSAGVTSSPLMLQVIRRGNFTGMSSTGMAKLKIENGNLILQTTADFSVQTGPPDLRIYLSNNANNITGATQIAELSTAGQTSGMHTWNVPATVSITQYRYAVVWCAQFGGTYGTADLGL
jgi:hypothetical protein